MKVKSPLFFWIALLLFLPLAYFVFDRIHFVVTARPVSAEVSRVTSQNDRCGSRRSKYNCTKYYATLRYEVQGRWHQISVSAGRQRGHNQPLSGARYRSGDREAVKYDPRQPWRAYRNTLWDIWGAPLMTFFMQIAMFVASFSDKRRRD
jgi:hypothetical protein